MPHRQNLSLIFAVMVLLIIGAGCQREDDSKADVTKADDSTVQGGRLSASQLAAANAALKALRKVTSATEVGVSYSQYGSLLIEAKPEIDGAMAVLPEGQLKSDISTVIEAHIDAREAWGEMITKDKLPLTYGIGKKLVEKYAMAFQTRGDRAIIYDSTRDRVVEDLWKHARIYLNSATSELTKLSG